MQFTQVLERVRRCSELPALVKALGHESDWEPIPRSWWPERSRLARAEVETGRIGRIGELPWIGITGLNAPAIARSAARILERRGDPAAIAALDCDSGRLVLTVAFESRPCLELLPSVTDGPALAVLERVKRVPRDGKLATAAHLAAALAGLGLGARFFAAFRGQLERLADSIGTRHRAEDRRTLALLQLNRLLFLYFVQSRGWLDSRPDFLGIAVDRCLARRGRLHDQLLKPLFFGTLNRRPEERSAVARRLGRIPFLNGGLFEPHPLERAWRGTIPNPVLRDVFDHLFERFHFTVHEGCGSAIAPDMLGRVFEGLMAPEDRGLSGSFYTPPRLVRTIFDHALIALMRGRLGLDEEAARRRLESPDPATSKLLHEITVLDPAAGSGAFLLGALERLAELRELGGGRGEGVRREILQRNLFGVDINPTAVRLTELRLWLAVVAADRADSPRSVQPLPNLDCLVRQGDSLADPLNLVARFPFRPGAAGSALARLRRRLVLATGDDKRAAARAVRECELQALRECLEVADRSIERGIRECMTGARASDLFGSRRGLDERPAMSSGPGEAVVPGSGACAAGWSGTASCPGFSTSPTSPMSLPAAASMRSSAIRPGSGRNRSPPRRGPSWAIVTGGGETRRVPGAVSATSRISRWRFSNARPSSPLPAESSGCCCRPSWLLRATGPACGALSPGTLPWTGSASCRNLKAPASRPRCTPWRSRPAKPWRNRITR